MHIAEYKVFLSYYKATRYQIAGTSLFNNARSSVCAPKVPIVQRTDKA